MILRGTRYLLWDLIIIEAIADLANTSLETTVTVVVLDHPMLTI